MALACEVSVSLRLLPVVFTILAGITLAQTPANDSSAALTVQGRVVQDPGGQPIRKADIQLQMRNQPSESHTATTDAEGKFQIEDVRPGSYRVILGHPGFVQPRGRRATTLSLTAPADARGLMLHMQVAATIYGKIVDGDGDPMPNVSVQAIGAGGGPAAAVATQGNGLTNDLGEYRIANLRAGKYTVTAEPFGHPMIKAPEEQKGSAQTHLGFARTYYPGTLDKTQAVPVDVQPGQELPLTFTPLTSPRFFIRGTIVKPRGAKLAELMLRSRDGSEFQHDSIAREDGSFEFPDLLPGSYSVYLMVFDPASMMADAQQNRAPQMQVMRLGQPLVITNANLEGVHLVPETPGRVRGRFRMDKERKMDWTQLSVIVTPEDSSGFMVGGLPSGLSMARVQSDGSFDLPNVSPGEYRLAITASSNNLQDYYTKSVNLDGKDVADTGFSVSGGSYSLDVVVCAEGATIEGTVVNEKGKPVSDATVIGAPNGERRNRLDVWGQDTSDAQGHFRLRGLSSGEYTVLAWEDPEGNVRNAEFVTSYQDRGEKVQLEDGAKKTLSVKVIAASDDDP